jgi:hypothetical protein
MMTARFLLMLLFALILDGCAEPNFPGTARIWEERTVSTLTSTNSLVMTSPLDWYASDQTGRYDVILPKGNYHLDAQDKDYSYYETSDNLSLVHTTDGDQNSRLFNGGIYISRNPDAPHPSGAFIDYKNGHKLLVFCFDSRFMGQEGAGWHYSDK